MEWRPRHGQQWHPGPDALYTVTWLSGSLMMPSAGRTPVCPSAHGRLIPQRSPCCHSVGQALCSDSGPILTPHHGPPPTLHSPATSCPHTRATSGPPTGSAPPSGRLSCPHHPQAWRRFPRSSCRATGAGHRPQPRGLTDQTGARSWAPGPGVAGAKRAHSLPETRTLGLRGPQERPHPGRRGRELNPEGQAIRKTSVTNGQWARLGKVQSRAGQPAGTCVGRGDTEGRQGNLLTRLPVLSRALGL